MQELLGHDVVRLSGALLSLSDLSLYIHFQYEYVDGDISACVAYKPGTSTLLIVHVDIYTLPGFLLGVNALDLFDPSINAVQNPSFTLYVMDGGDTNLYAVVYETLYSN